MVLPSIIEVLKHRLRRLSYKAYAFRVNQNQIVTILLISCSPAIDFVSEDVPLVVVTRGTGLLDPI